MARGNGLGTYSDLKYQTLSGNRGDGYDVRGRRGEMNYLTMRAYVLQFKYYCKNIQLKMRW
ncbi:MAG: hypothetical protein ACLUDU_13210 [Butyricimonas faecihominis]